MCVCFQLENPAKPARTAFCLIRQHARGTPVTRRVNLGIGHKSQVGEVGCCLPSQVAEWTSLPIEQIGQKRLNLWCTAHENALHKKLKAQQLGK